MIFFIEILYNMYVLSFNHWNIFGRLQIPFNSWLENGVGLLGCLNIETSLFGSYNKILPSY